MKKWIITALCIFLAVSVTACSQRDNTKEPEISQSQSVSENPSTPSEQESHNELPILSDEDEYGLPNMSAEYQTYFDKYLSAWAFYIPFEVSFNEENYLSDFSPYLLFMGCAAIEGNFQKYGSNGLFPADIVESTVARYFFISVEQYREQLKRRGETNDWAKNNEYYDAAKNSYYFDGGYGGASMNGIITDAREENNTIVISCDWYDVEDNFCFSHTVIICKGDKDNEFMYIENHVTGVADNKANAEPPEGTLQAAFSAPVAYEMGMILAETVDFSIYLPKNWTVADLEISEDGRKVAEVLPSRIVYNKSEPFENTDFAYAEAITVRDITAGLYPGKCYHMQTEVTEGGMTFFQNDLIYCLNISDKMILIVFYPSYGIGIGTQNEQFSSYLNTIQLS